MKNGHILGFLSILTVVISFIFFLVQRGPNANLSLGITVLSSLGILGLIFAILAGIARKWVWLAVGVLGNGVVLVIAYLLWIAAGIGGV
ncbi:hypothetical protein [Halobacillus litoralis]|uniref:ABC transporter permease n=1 Tax=Halobacillus litoralis TaxID=45668 RepID=A0A410M9F7_9BACI|nr:hypothetical protein [Halobacillus litoralis]QAS51316.1 hypothetical protein HLI_03350 [Halobacillus litoralis]